MAKVSWVYFIKGTVKYSKTVYGKFTVKVSLYTMSLLFAFNFLLSCYHKTFNMWSDSFSLKPTAPWALIILIWWVQNVCMRMCIQYAHTHFCMSLKSYYRMALYLMCCDTYFLINFHLVIVVIYILSVFESDGKHV